MDQDRHHQQYRTVTVQAKEPFLSVGTEEGEHAQNNRQDYRQGE